MARHLLPLALLAVAGLLWAAHAAAPPLAVDLGAHPAGMPAAFGDGRFLGGFYDAEAGEGARFRWSGPGARLVLHGAPPGAALLALRLSGERLVAQGAPGVTLARGATFAAFDAAPGWRVYRVLLPPGAAAAATGEALPISLRTALGTPGAAVGGRDYRELGAPLDWGRVAPADGAPTGALARALWLTWAVGLAAAAAYLTPLPPLRREERGPRSAGTLGALAVVLGLGGALAVWAWRAPHSLAWALPPTPWALAAGTALLAAWGRSGLGLAAGAAPLRAAGLAALGAGVGLMHARLAVGAGVALAALGLVALAAPRDGIAAAAWAPAAPAGGARRHLPALGAIFVLALGLRLLRLDELPFGLWRDEARHGLVALRMVEDPSYRPAYVLDLRVHLPGLGLYPFAAALKLFGVHMWTLRAATALAGALTVLPLYAVAARLSGSRAVGLGAALLLAASSWHISVSRLAFPTVFEPLLSMGAWALLLWALWPAPAEGRVASRGLWAAALAGLGAGLLLGAAAQTYHTGRVTPLAAGLLCLLLLPTDGPGRRRWLACVGAAAAGFALAVAPLAAYALARPGDFNDRVGDVFLLGEAALAGRAPLAALDANLGRHLLMFTAEGDANGRHHAPLRPLLDIVSGMGLLLGLAALLRALGDWRSRLLLGTLVIGLLPGLLAVDAPHAMRTFGAVAPAYVIAALGWAAALRVAGARQPTTNRGRVAPAALGVALACAAVVGLNAWLYFGVMPRDPEVFAGFYPVQSQMGVYVREHGGGAIHYVPRDVREHPSFAFLTAGLPLATFDPAAPPGMAQLDPPPPPGAPFLLTGYFAEQEAAALAAVLGAGAAPEAAGPPFPDGRGPTFYLYRAR